MSFSTPADLAQEVLSQLVSSSDNLPPLNAITQLFEVMYCCSVSKEEAERINFHIIYLDPNNSDTSPPPVKLPDRWRFFELKAPIEVTLPNLRKLAPATRIIPGTPYLIVA